MNSRYEQLCQWLSQATNITEPELKMVAGDASFRRYYRLFWKEASYIVMDAPPPEEDCAPFVRIAQDWFKEGIAVPKVMAQNLEQGFLLLQDFGDDQLLPHLEQGEAVANELYTKALEALIPIQYHSDPELPHYDHAMLLREMHLFRDWFCQQWLGLTLSEQECSLLEHTFEHLIHSALQQPQVIVHRDFHSRNLMLTDSGRIGIIDFQDAVTGPITYDAVSLLKDCYIHWPAAKVDQWRDHYMNQIQTADLLPANYPKEKFRQEFDLMGAQRHLKAIGIFSRLWLRDNKPGFLNDIPRTLQHLLETTAQYQNLTQFHHWLLERIVPVLNEKQQVRENA